MLAAFAFAFAIVLAPFGSLVLTPMEHAQMRVEGRDALPAIAVSEAVAMLMDDPPRMHD